jgi:hypothetical protein
MSRTECVRRRRGDVAKGRAGVGPGLYSSSMCSTAGDGALEADGAADLGTLGLEIEDLATAARGAAPDEVAARLARLWRMVADLDPELARRVARYGDGAGRS